MMAGSRSHGGVHAHYFREPRSRRAPNGPSPHNYPLLWRLAALALLPLLAWLLTVALHERIPQSAGDLHYDVVVNRITGAACIEVKNAPTPKGLADLSCD